MGPKKTATILLRLPEEMATNLRLIAEFKGLEAPELLRRSARAMIEHFRENKNLPDHMGVIAKSVDAPQLVAAEDAGEYGDGAAKEKPPKPLADKSQRTRGGGPAHRVSKSA